MSLEGLRAWVAEVERKLAKRTRVMLALVAIAIGVAAASVFLAIDTRSGSVSEGDVQELQGQLEQRIDEVEAEVEPTAGIGLAPPAGGDAGGEGSEEGGAAGDAGSGSGGDSAGGASSGGGENLQDLLEQAGAAGN